MAETKKFLDQEGVSTLWAQVDAEVAAKVKVEADRAKAAEKVNADEIAALVGTDTNKTIRAIAKEEAAAVVGAAPEAMDTLEEVAAWIANDQSGAAAMAADINKNKAAIAAIYSVDAEGTASGTLVSEIARVEGKADENTTAINAINNETTGILAVAKKYAVDANAAKEAAVNAKTAAVTAQETAEAAQETAEGARDAAQAAQGAAEGARDVAAQHKADAEAAKGAAETAQGLAEEAKGAAETARDAAKKSVDELDLGLSVIDGQINIEFEEEL